MAEVQKGKLLQQFTPHENLFMLFHTAIFTW